MVIYLKTFVLGVLLGCILDMYCYHAVIEVVASIPGSYIAPWHRSFHFLLLPRLIWGKHGSEFMRRRTIFFPLIEISMGFFFVLNLYYYQTSIQFFSNIIFVNILLAVSIINILEQLRTIIPDELSLLGILIGFLFSLPKGGITIVDSLLGIVVGFSTLYIIGYIGEIIFKRESMGGGSIKFMAMIGAFVGLKGVLIAIFFFSTIAAIIGILVKLISGNEYIPTAIFQSIGAIIALFWGDLFWIWYWKLLSTQ